MACLRRCCLWVVSPILVAFLVACGYVIQAENRIKTGQIATIEMRTSSTAPNKQIEADHSVRLPAVKQAVEGRKLLWHVGPLHAGASSMHQWLKDHRTDLWADGHRYETLNHLLEACPSAIAAALADGETLEQVTCYQALSRALVTDSSLIVTWIPTLDELPIVQEHLLPLFQQHFSITVIGVYRRWAEWLLDVKSSADANKCVGGDWPSQGGTRCRKETFRYLNRVTKGFRQTSNVLGTDSLDLNVWRDMGLPAKVINLHEHALVELFCHVLEDMPETCAAAQADELPRLATIDSWAFAYDNLVYDAADAGLLEEAMAVGETRREVAEDVREHASSVVDWPLLCPSREDVQQLLKASQRMAQQLSVEDAGLDDSFWDLYEHKLFCSPDTETILAGKTSWQEVLESLAEPRLRLLRS